MKTLTLSDSLQKSDSAESYGSDLHRMSALDTPSRFTPLDSNGTKQNIFRRFLGSATALALVLIFLFSAAIVQANVTVTAATGGTNISADKAANSTNPAGGTWTTLGNIVINENNNADLGLVNGSARTLILTAPTGWNFLAGTGTVTTNGADVTGTPSISVTSTTITISLIGDTSPTSEDDQITISGIQVKATDGSSLPSTGQIYRSSTNAGSLSVSGVTNTSNTSGSGGTNFGSLSQTAGAGTKLVFSTQPGGGTGGSNLSTQPVVTIQDQFSNTATSATNSITLAIGTNPSSGTLTATTNPLTATSGVATFAGVKIDKAGTGYTLTATSGTLTSATSSAFNITVGTASKLAFTTQPGGGTGGVAFGTQPVVTIQDAGGNTVTGATNTVTLAIGTNAGPGGVLTAPTSPLSATGGVATFSGVSINKVGTGYTLTATASGLTLATSTAFDITLGPAVKLGFTTEPGGGTGGVVFGTQPVVSVQDAGGNTVTGATDIITLAILSNPSAGVLTAPTSPLTAVSGVASFTGVKIDKAGTGYTLTATSGTLTAATSASFNITVGPAASLVFTTEPGGGTGGVAFAVQPVVTVRDAGGNTVTGATNAITLAIGTNGGPGGVLTAPTSPLTPTSGIATFTGVNIDKAGTGYTLIASSSGLPDATSSAFDITVGPAAKLAFTTQPGGGTPGTVWTIQPVVTIQDAGGNTVTTSTDAVTLAIGNNAGPGGVLTAPTSPLSAISGVATFTGVKIDLTGSGYTLTASSGTLTAATSDPFNIAGAPTKYIVTSSDYAPKAGTIVTITAQLADVSGIAVGIAGKTVTWSKSDLVNGSFSAPTSTTDASGTVTVNFTVHTVSGTATTVTATDNTTPTALTGTSTSITTVANDASKLAFTTQPGTGTGGSNLSTQPVVTVEDQYGNKVTDAVNPITLAITSPAGATLSAITNPLAATAGIATFTGVSIDKAGTGYTLTASTTGGIITNAISDPFDITVGVATKLAFTTQPGNEVLGSVLSTQPVVTIQDAGGNTVTTAADAITLAIANNAGPGGVLTAPTSPLAAISGVATFTGVSIDKMGTGYTLSATDGAVTPATSAPFNVTYGPLDHFLVEAAAGGDIASQVPGTPFNIKITAQDANNNTVANFVGTVTISSNGTLSAGGGVTSAFTAGVLTVNGITFINVATGSYHITALQTGGSITSDSHSFTVTHNNTTYYSRITGNWNSNNTWSLIPGGSAVGTGIYPVAGDAVNIQLGNVVSLTADASCSTIAITNTNTSLTSTSTVATGTYTLNAESISITAGSSGSGQNRNSAVTVTTGTINVSGNITFGGTSTRALLTFSGAGTLNIGGNLGNGGTLTQSTGTINYNADGPQTVGTYNYYNLTLSGSGLKTLTGTNNVAGILSVEGTATESGTVTYGTNSTLQYKTTDSHIVGPEWPTSFAGTGGVIVNLSSGSLTVSSAKGIANNSSLNLVNGQLATGTFLTMNSTSTLNVSGGTLSGAPQGAGTYNVVYTGGSKTAGDELMGSGLNNVTLNLTSGTVSLNQAPTIKGILTLTNGLLATTDTNIPTLTRTTNDAIAGASSASYISGPVSWTLPVLSSSVTYTFPVGKGGSYLPFALVNPTTSGSTTVQVEAYNSAPIGGYDATLTEISTSEYWRLGVGTPANFTDANVSLTKTSIGTYRAVAASVDGTSNFTSLDGTVASNTVTSIIDINGYRYFTLGKMPEHYMITSSNYAPLYGISGILITAQLVDGNGAPVATSPVRTITWGQSDVAANAGSFALPTSTTDANGLATISFTASIKAPRATHITATDGVATGTSPEIKTVPGPATKLGWGVQPSSAAAGSAIPAFTVQVQDAGSNLVSSYASTPISLVFATDAGGGSTISGTNPKSTSGGVATFDNISINKVGTGFSLLATNAVGLTQSPNSALFDITNGIPSTVTSTITATPSSILADGLSTSVIKVQAKDSNGNNITTSTAGLVVTITSDIGTITATTDNTDGTYSATLTSAVVAGTAHLGFTFTIAPAEPVAGTNTTTVVFTPGALDHFKVVGSGFGEVAITPQSVGVAFNIKIIAKDVNNNTVTSYTGGVTGVDITSTGTTTPASIPTTGTFTNGVYDPQSITFAVAGNFTITATQHSNGTKSGTSDLISVSVSHNRYSVNDGPWSNTSTWSDIQGGAPGASVPTGTDVVYIDDAHTVNVDMAATCGSVTFANNTTQPQTNVLSIDGANSLTINGDVFLPSATSGSGGVNRLDVNNGTLNVQDVRFTSTSGSSSTASLHSLTLNQGTITITGDVTTDGTSSASAYVIISSTGTLNVGGSFFYTGTGSTRYVGGTLTAATGSTVNINGVGDATGHQYIKGTTYSNITISNSLYKDFSSPSSGGWGGGSSSLIVNGTFTIHDIASINVLSGAVTYGTSPTGFGTLKYQTTNARTTTTEEWPSTFNSGSGGVIIANTAGSITLDANKTFSASVPLNINAGGTLNTGGRTLTLGGNFINNGTFNATTSNITVNNIATQQIAGFTSGSFTFTKPSATATLTGAVSTGLITLNGAGILNTGGKNITGTSLTLSGTSNITLTGVAHTIQFGDSHLSTWGSSAILTITGWQGTYSGTAGTAGRIFAGTNSSGLTVAQLAKIRFYDGVKYFPSMILSTGEVVPTFTITPGTVAPQPLCVSATTSATGTVDFVSTFSGGTSSYQVMLSDATGSFASATAISSVYNAVTSYPSGTITFTIPAGTASSTHYKVRVDCTIPSAVPGAESAEFTVSNGVFDVSGLYFNIGPGYLTANWTNPGNCYDDVLVVAYNQSITGTPSGAYSPNTVYGSGTPTLTPTGGGFPVYQGTGNTVTVTNLTNGVPYYFKIFTRHGTDWSAGIESSASPAGGGTSLATDYFISAGTGNWTTLSTWLSSSDNGVTVPWHGASLIPDSQSAGINIRNGHIVTVNTAISIDQTTIEAGGEIEHTANTITLLNGTGTDLDVFGTLDNSASISATGAQIVFETVGTGGGIYEHAYTTSGGTVPTATWNTGSTCLIKGALSGTVSVGGINGQTFYDLTWNCPSQTSNWDLTSGSGTTTINHNFTVISTGSGSLRVSQANTFNLLGNFIVTGGTMNLDHASSGTDSNHPTYNLTGNFTNSGTIIADDSDGAGTFNFVGNVSTPITHVFTNSGTMALSNGNSFNNGGNFNVNVPNGSILDMGTSVLGGSNNNQDANFTLSAGGGIITKHISGLMQDGSAGAIQVANSGGFGGGNGSITFNSGGGSDFTYNGTAAQVTGDGPNDQSGARTLRINNNNGVTLSSSVTLTNTGVLYLTSGIFTTSSTNRLNLTNTNASTAIVGGSSLSFIDGPVRWSLPSSTTTTATYHFPVGKNTTYLPFDLINPVTGFSPYAQVEAFDAGSGGTFDATLASISETEYWQLTRGNLTNGKVSLTRPTLITPLDVIGATTSSPTGTYTTLNGTKGSYSVTGSDLITNGPNNYNYFVFAGKMQSITTGSIPFPFCAGSTASVPFTVDGTFYTGNVFTAQLSNDNFVSNIVDIGTLTQTTAGTISATIPSETPNGTNFRIRVISSSPARTGSLNSNGDLENQAITVITGQSTLGQTQCVTGTFTPITVTATGSGTLTYQWYKNSTASNTSGTSLGTSNGADTYSYTPQATTAGTLYYYCVVTGTCSSATSAVSGAFVVNPATGITTQSTDAQTTCVGVAFSPITVTAVGTNPSYQWFSNTTASNTLGTSLGSDNGAQTNSYTPVSSVVGTLYYYCVVHGDCGTDVTSAVSGAFVVNPATAITAQSTAGQTTCITVAFANPITVTATGTAPLTYQWYSNTTAVNSGGTSLGSDNGAQTNSYTPQVADAGTLYYYCVVHGACGADQTSAISGAFVVNPATAISAQSTAAQTQCINGTFDPITVTATGTNLHYQWYSKATAENTGGVSLLDANGAQTNSYTPQTTTAGTLYYYCVVHGDCGADKTTDISGAFLVNPSTAITAQSTGTQTQCVTTGTFTPITVTATGVGLSYQWYSNTTAVNSGGTSLGTNNGADTYSYTPQTTTAGTTYYYCVVTGTCGTLTTAISGAFIVNPATAISAQSTAAQTKCINGTFDPITVTATGTNLSYQWFSNTTANNSLGTSLGTGNGAQTDSYTPQTTTAGTLYYYCVVHGDCGEDKTTDISGAFLVNPATSISSQSTAAQTQCINGTFTSISVTGAGVGLTYQWFSNTTASNSGGSNLGSANGAQSDTYTPQATVAGTTYYYCVVTGTCGSATSAVSGAFVVNPATAISSQSTAAQTQCINGTFTAISVTATGTGVLTYQWYSNTSASTSGSSNLGAANGAQTNSYTPQTTNAGTLYYYCVVHSDCGPDVTSAISGAFLVNPATSISSQSTATQTQCINGTFSSISVTGAGVGLSYQWFSNASSSNSGGSNLGSANGAQSDTYTPQATVAGTTYYYCVVTGTCGSATSAVSGAFIVNPATAITSQSTATQTQCITTGVFTPITVTATGVGTLSYQWFSNSTASNSGGTSLGSANGAQTSSYTPQTTAAGTL